MRLFRVGRERPVWFVEALLLVGGYFAFGVVRSAVDRGNPAATGNALSVQRLEHTLHLAVEHPLNQAVLGQPIAIYGTGYFYRLCVLAVPTVLIWLYVRHPGRYRYLRTVLVVATLIDLPLVWLFPESPPRFAQSGIVDYIADYDILGGASLRDPNSGLNLLAAMPSMHIAWTSWSAYAVFLALRGHHPRAAWLAWLFPLLTAFVVLVTGHHYVLDVVAGVAVLAAAIALTRWAGRLRRAHLRAVLRSPGTPAARG